MKRKPVDFQETLAAAASVANGLPVQFHPWVFKKRLSVEQRMAILGVSQDVMLTYLRSYFPNPRHRFYRRKRLDHQARLYGVDPEILDWETARGPLRSGDLLDHVLERRLVLAVVQHDRFGYCFALHADLDTHSAEQRNSLRDRYEQLIALLPYEHMTFTSSESGGLRVTWPLRSFYHVSTIARLADAVEAQLDGQVEIYPRPNCVLRPPLGPGSILLDDDLNPAGLEEDKAEALLAIHCVWTGDRRQWLPVADVLEKLKPQIQQPKEPDPAFMRKARDAKVILTVADPRNPSVGRPGSLSWGRALRETGLTERGTRNNATLSVIRSFYADGIRTQVELTSAVLEWLKTKNNGLSSDYTRNPRSVLKQTEYMVENFFAKGCPMPRRRSPKAVELTNEEMSSVTNTADTLMPKLCESRRRETLIGIATFIKRQILCYGQPPHAVEVPTTVLTNCGAQRNSQRAGYWGKWKSRLDEVGIMRPTDGTAEYGPNRATRYTILPIHSWADASRGVNQSTNNQPNDHVGSYGKSGGHRV